MWQPGPDDARQPPGASLVTPTHGACAWTCGGSSGSHDGQGPFGPIYSAMRRGRVTIVTTVSGSQELRLRRAGRVIVLDPEDRVLLFRYDEAPPNGRHWCTPGGGLDDGEDYPAGARRELTEETGWTDVPIGPEVYEHVRIMEYADAMVRQHERFYLARVETGRRGLGEVAAMHVSDGIAAWHWWTLAELDATDELVWPAGLADLIRWLTG